MEADVSDPTDVTAVKDGEDMTAPEKEDLHTFIFNVPHHKDSSLNVLEKHFLFLSESSKWFCKIKLYFFHVEN